ncbi:MAG: hypothetical protein ACQEXJ_09365 [Myxococcota bacterium]
MSGRVNLLVGGAPHAGSTLLCYLLDRHPGVVAVSQLEWLDLLAAGRDIGPCTCGEPILECPFWVEVLEDHLAGRWRRGQPLPRLDLGPLADPAPPSLAALRVGTASLMLPRRGFLLATRVAPEPARLRRQAANTLSLYASIRRVSGARVVVDTSKNPRRMKAVRHLDPAAFRALHLVRDGRGHTWSYMRREGMSARRAAFIWERNNRLHEALFGRAPGRRHLRVRYEDLCRRPGREAARILGLAGRSPAPGILGEPSLDKTSAHLVSGNPMRYDRGATTIDLDEAWRGHLRGDDLEAFERVAGRRNRRYGYPRE